MKNPFARLRMGNIFAGEQPSDDPESMMQRPQPFDPRMMQPRRMVPPPVMEEEPDEPDDAISYFDEIRRIRSNPGPAMSQYQEMLKNMPSEADYQPTKMRRVAGITAGIAAGLRDPAAGPGVTQSILRDPYDRAMHQYKNQLGATGEAANLERQDMQAQLRALSEARALGLKYDEFKLKQMGSERDYGLKKRSTASTEMLNSARAANLLNPDYDYKEQQDGSVLAINKKNPKDRQTIPGKSVAAGNFKVNQRRAAIAEKDAGTRAAAQASLEKYQQIMGSAATKRAQTGADRNSQRNQTPYQQARAVNNALMLMKADPRWKNFIEADSNNSSIFMLGDDDGSERYKVFKKELKRQVDSALKKGMPFEEDRDDDDFNDFIIQR